jgi:ABC-type antimicrobial peptide transport system permease subunit
MYFAPITQRTSTDHDPIDEDLSFYAGALVIQTAQANNDMEKICRQTLASINPNLTIVKFQTFQAQIDDIFTEDRMISRLTMLFGTLALLLATIGLYGVTAYTVVRRTSEIGIRMALGAERGRVMAMILRGALIQTGIGLAIGVPVAYYCVKYVKSQLYEITSASPTVMLFAIGTLALAACVAGLVPARRAASIEPARALRTE